MGTATPEGRVVAIGILWWSGPGRLDMVVGKDFSEEKYAIDRGAADHVDMMVRVVNLIHVLPKGVQHLEHRGVIREAKRQSMSDHRSSRPTATDPVMDPAAIRSSARPLAIKVDRRCSRSPPVKIRDHRSLQSCRNALARDFSTPSCQYLRTVFLDEHGMCEVGHQTTSPGGHDSAVRANIHVMRPLGCDGFNRNHQSWYPRLAWPWLETWESSSTSHRYNGFRRICTELYTTVGLYPLLNISGMVALPNPHRNPVTVFRHPPLAKARMRPDTSCREPWPFPSSRVPRQPSPYSGFLPATTDGRKESPG